MSDNKNKGEKAEQKAIAYLKKIGHKIIETNWRFGKLEVDIISSHENFLVFTEVKFRSSDFFGQPHEFVTRTKQKKIVRAANEYVLSTKFDGEVRFDVVGIGEFDLQYFKEAFRPY